ncbi:MAG: DUF2064 domain-containing protein, partial [Chitinivibrionia bacterium]|nr:DUF2064 domain-containing protein [Chitinivibrionia bacterium]
MSYCKNLGIFIHVPPGGGASPGFAPPLSEQEAANLSAAFMKDLLNRIARLKKTTGTIFYPDEEGGFGAFPVPAHFSLVRQEGTSFGERLYNAFRRLLSEQGQYAVMMGTGSPDVPLQYIKRAFLKLKHKDVVVGPGTDGGYYLIGMKSP